MLYKARHLLGFFLVINTTMPNLLDTLTAGLNSQDTLKSYQHASKIFVDGNFIRSPKYAFMFYVQFDFDEGAQGLLTSAKSAIQLGALAKSAQLPKFTIDTQTVNAYNRPNIIQKKLKYDPVSFKFHDDSSDIIREFWYDYMSFYYRDGDYQLGQYLKPGESKYEARNKDGWGFNPRPSFNDSFQNSNYNPLRAIRIFSFSLGRFSEYVLINPIITAFRHGEHTNEGSGLLEHDMTVNYETVKYFKGAVTQDNFSDSFLLLYDNAQSPLKTGVTSSVFGTGGLVDTLDNVMADLSTGNFGAAFLKLNKAQQTFKGKNIGEMAVNEGLNSIQVSLGQGTNPSSPVTVPSVSDSTNTIRGSGSSTIADSSGIQTSTGTNTLNASGNNARLPNGTTIVDTLNREVRRDEALPSTDYRASSDGALVSTVPSSTGPFVPAQFPQLPKFPSASTSNARTLPQYSIEELTAEIAARYEININDADTLLRNLQQGKTT
jgi:hypothetical protein